MKNRVVFIVFGIMLVCLAACKQDDKFDIYSYNGEFPRNMNGSQIKTYEPMVIGGVVKVKYNGHNWNHAPFLKVLAAEFVPWDTTSHKRTLEILVMSLMDDNLLNPCALEMFSFRIPARLGTTDLNAFADQMEDDLGVSFSTADCDATKDRYNLDKTQNNWIKIVRYNTASRDVAAEFEVYFKMDKRNADFGPVFPEKVTLKGTINTSLKE